MQRLHVSGAGTEGCVTLVTGGDDQAVHVAVLQLRSSSDGTSADVLSSSIQLTMLCCRRVHSAHTSAIRVSFRLPNCSIPFLKALCSTRGRCCLLQNEMEFVSFWDNLLMFMGAVNALHNSV